VQIIDQLFTEFIELSGDRNFKEDFAIIGGLARFRGRPVIVMGTEKGSTTEERIKRNFGMVRPEGYRKAIRLMQLADQFGLPVISFVDTAGAYPGRGAEERGQAEAIARSIQACLNLKTPLISAIVGEGGSGGAIALATGNKVIMFEHAVYSVISPEGCASILWRSSDKAETASEALRLTAADMMQLGIIDQIVDEPVGGAHRDVEAALLNMSDAIEQEFSALSTLSPDELRANRRDKYVAMGEKSLA
jgi:acetyl-CoA carboxylase carboxyl transferase subunit alpha